METKTAHKIAKDRAEAWTLQGGGGDKLHAHIQWKGTDVCMDVYCVCGKSTHIDGEFAYNVKCTYCKRVYFVNGHIELIELKEEPENCVLMQDIEDNTTSTIIASDDMGRGYDCVSEEIDQ